MTQHRLLYLTLPDSASGCELARWMVEQRLVACAHLLPAGQSFYWWDGELAESREQIILAKTTADLVEHAIDQIAQRHAYDCPCILSIAVDAGHGPFLTWISQQTRTA